MCVLRLHTLNSSQVNAIQQVCSQVVNKVLQSSSTKSTDDATIGVGLQKAIALLSKFYSLDHYLLTELELRYIRWSNPKSSLMETSSESIASFESTKLVFQLRF